MKKENLFHAYDIRGIYNDNLNKEFAYKLGNAFGIFLKQEFKNKQDFLVVIGRDGRKSSFDLYESFVRGLINQKVDVLNIGKNPTDALYFALNYLKTDGGIMITGSHNPKEYNGFKIVLKGPKFLSGNWGLPELKALSENNFKKNKEKGDIKDYKIIDEYRSYVLSLINKESLKKQKVVIDGAGGVGAKLIKGLDKYIPVNLNCIFCNIDNNFSGHSPNPIIFKNIKDLSKKVKSSKASFGLAFDGDGDRTVFVDEKGNPIEADIILALFSKYFLEKYPNSTIVYNMACSKVVPEVIKQYGGRAVKNRTGSTFMKKVAKEKQAILGGEISAHFCYKDIYFCESGLYSFLIMLTILSNSDKPLSEIIKPFQKYYRTNETNFKVDDRQEAIALLSDHFKGGDKYWIDGLSVEFNDWWFNVRSSNTEPLLRVVVEADNKLLADKKMNIIKEIIDKVN